MISLVLSCVNPPDSAFRSIASALRYMPSGSEVVVHVDPSETHSLQQFKSLQTKGLSLLISNERVGFAEGLNLAVGQARHELIARLDVDDYSYPWRWSYQMSRMRSVDFHFGGLAHKITKLFPSLPGYPVRLETEEFAIVSLFRNPGFHPAAMFRKSVFLELGGYRPAIAEDYDFWLRALTNGYEFERGTLPVTRYARHPGQATSQIGWAERVEMDPYIIESKAALKTKLSEAGVETSMVLRRLLKGQPLAKIEFRDIVYKESQQRHGEE